RPTLSGSEEQQKVLQQLFAAEQPPAPLQATDLGEALALLVDRDGYLESAQAILPKVSPKFLALPGAAGYVQYVRARGEQSAGNKAAAAAELLKAFPDGTSPRVLEGSDRRRRAAAIFQEAAEDLRNK